MAQARVPRSERLGADVAAQSLGRAAGAQPLSMDRGRGGVPGWICRPRPGQGEPRRGRPPCLQAGAPATRTGWLIRVSQPPHLYSSYLRGGFPPRSTRGGLWKGVQGQCGIKLLSKTWILMAAFVGWKTGGLP